MIPFSTWENIPSGSTPALILPFAPDWADGVQESLSWRMGSVASQAGVEERRSVRRDPRLRIEFTSLVVGEEMSLLQSLLLGWANRVWAVPLWHGQCDTTSAVTSGATVIPVGDNPSTLFHVAGWALLWSDTYTYRCVQVLSVSDTFVTLDSPIVGNFPIGSKLVPLQAMQLQDSQTFAPLTSAVARVSWVFEQVPGHGQVLGVWGAGEWSETFPADAANTEPRNHYLAYPHNWSGSPEISVSTLADTHDPGIGTISRRLAMDRVSPVWGIDVLLDSRAASAQLRKFLSAHRGPTVAFWAPSPLRDLGISDDSTDGVLLVRADGLRLAPPALRMGVEITLPGSEIRERVAAVGTDSVTLARDPGPIAVDDVGRTRWVSRARLAVESITIRHLTHRISTVRLPVVAVDMGRGIEDGPDMGGGAGASTLGYFAGSEFTFLAADAERLVGLELEAPVGENVLFEVLITTHGGSLPSVTDVVQWYVIPAGFTTGDGVIPTTASVDLIAGMDVPGCYYALTITQLLGPATIGTPATTILTCVG